MGSANANVRIPQLGEIPFFIWQERVKWALGSLGLKNYVEDVTIYERSLNQKNLKEIDKVKSIIGDALSQQDLMQIIPCSNPIDIMKVLENKYRGPKAKNIFELFKELQTTKFNNSITDLFSQIRRVFLELKNKNVCLPESLMNAIISNLLPKEYESAQQVLAVYNTGKDDSDLMSDTAFESHLLELERNLKTDSKLVAETENVGLSASSSKQTKKQTKKKRFGGKCYNCGLIGHMSKDCRRPKQNVDPSGAAANPITLVNWTGIMPSNNSSFYSDSGASYHIVNDHSLLSDVRKSNVRIDSIHGVEENVQFGTLLCQFFNGTVWLDIKLLDVAFIPNQPFNLISTGNLTNPRIHSGMKVIEEDGKLTVYRFGKPILTGEQTSEIRNLYKLNVRPVNRNTTMASVSSDDFAIWHERLCHCSTSVLERMVALKTIIGLPKDIRNNIAYCSTCHTGKMTDVSHKPVVSVNENIVSGMKLHVDIGGYMKPSIHGNQYYLLAVDDSSSYLKIGFMKQRSEVYDKLKLFINEVKIDTGKDVLVVRSDNGSEFRSKNVQQYFRDCGIVHELGVVGVPQHN